MARATGVTAPCTSKAIMADQPSPEDHFVCRYLRSVSRGCPPLVAAYIKYLFLFIFRRQLKLSEAKPRNSPRQSNQQLSQWKGSQMAQSILKALCISAVRRCFRPHRHDRLHIRQPGRRRRADVRPRRTSSRTPSTRRIHTTLVAAVKAAGLVDTLQGAGPFTVFAPTNRGLRRRCPPAPSTRW